LKIIHGDLIGSRNKGPSGNLYYIWVGIKRRCENKKAIDEYKDYGAKNIKCEFNSYLEFKNYVIKNLGNRPNKNYTIDRINTKGNYSLGNLRWATKKIQSLNRGLFKNKTSKYRGVSFHKLTNKWMAQITIDSKKLPLGIFKNELDAVEAYLEKYYNHYKKFPPEYIPLKLKNVVK